MRIGTCLLYKGHTLQGAPTKLAYFCSAPVAGFHAAVDSQPVPAVPARRRLLLLHQLRRTAPRRSPWRTATFETLRRAFLKIAVRIEELNTRIKIALPSAYPYRNALIAMAASIAAQGP